MKKFIRNLVKKVIDRLFGSIIMEIVGEDKANHCTELVRGVIRESDLVCQDDYYFDGFISSEDYDLESFVTDGDYDFDSMLTKRDFDPDEYVTQTSLEDQMDGFDPRDFVSRDDFDPDEYIQRHDLESELADCGFQQLNPDDHVTKDEFDDALDCFKKSLEIPTQPRHEVIAFLNKLVLCANAYVQAMPASEEGIKS